MPTVIIPPTDVSPNTGTGSEVLSNSPTLTTPNIGAATGTSFNLTGSGTLGTTLTVNGTTDSSSKDTGAIVTEGGLGVEKSATIGGNLTVSGTGMSSFAGGVQVSNTLAAKGTNESLTLQPGPGTGGINYAFGQGTGDHVWYGGTTERMRLTFGGNLTVSGTGMSSFAGGVQVSNTLAAKDTNASLTLQPGPGTGGINYAFGQGTGDHVFYGGTTERMRLGYGGNLLIGTAIDSANGKLQLATHTTSAGGIGFGTDTSLYRSDAGRIVLTHVGGTAPIFQLFGGATQYLYIEGGASNSNISQVSGSLSLKSNNTTALTLDSSQNATFAGTSLTVDGASTGSTVTLKRASNANGAIISYKTTTTSKWYHGLRGLIDDNWYLQNDVAGNTALLFDASTSNATFAGTVKIANTAAINGVYTTTTTFDFGTIANNDASSVCTLTMTGVSSSDSIIVSPTDGDNFPQFCTISAVPSGNSVAIRLYNGSGSSRTVGSRSIRVTAIKF